MSDTSPTTPGAGEQPVFIVLGPQDAGEVLTLQRAAYVTEAAAHDDFRLPPLTESLAEVRAALSASEIVALGIRDDGRLVGAVRLCLAGRVVELGRLIVAPDRQGEGLGTRLLRHAETVFPDAQELRLFTGEHSASNLRRYARLGYQETARTSAGHYQLVHLTKTLR